jgi:dephospho-CoA kinase
MKHTITVNREVSIVKIALTGKMRSGKDTIANHLYIKYNFSQVSFGDALKKNAHATFPWIYEWNKPRALYQQFGQLMREIEPDVWIKHAERAVKGVVDYKVGTNDENIGIVITDVRQQNEVDWCRANGFSIIRVTAPDEERIARAIAAGDDFSEKDLEHETEQAIDGFEVDAEIVNDGSVDDLKRKIDGIMGAIQ